MERATSTFIMISSVHERIGPRNMICAGIDTTRQFSLQSPVDVTTSNWNNLSRVRHANNARQQLDSRTSGYSYCKMRLHMDSLYAIVIGVQF